MSPAHDSIPMLSGASIVMLRVGDSNLHFISIAHQTHHTIFFFKVKYGEAIIFHTAHLQSVHFLPPGTSLLGTAFFSASVELQTPFKGTLNPFIHICSSFTGCGEY